MQPPDMSHMRATVEGSLQDKSMRTLSDRSALRYLHRQQRSQLSGLPRQRLLKDRREPRDQVREAVHSRGHNPATTVQLPRQGLRYGVPELASSHAARQRQAWKDDV